MNEQNEFERLVADQLASAGVGQPPESAIEDTIARAEGSRRLPEWLALIKESPMRTNSHLAVGSPTVRVVAIMAMTMLLALALAAAGAGAKQLLAADGLIVVAQDGSGDYTTIADAVASQMTASAASISFFGAPPGLPRAPSGTTTTRQPAAAPCWMPRMMPSRFASSESSKDF